MIPNTILNIFFPNQLNKQIFFAGWGIKEINAGGSGRDVTSRRAD